MKKLRSIGYSRIPVYRGDNKHDIIGVLLMKQLVGVNPQGKRVKNLRLNLRKPLIVPCS